MKNINLISIDVNAWTALSQGAVYLSTSGHASNKRPKVLKKDNQIIKCFFWKKGLSSRRFFPEWKRFVNHAHLLQQRGITTVTIDACYRVPALGMDCVVYTCLAGTDLRSLVQNGLEISCGSELRADPTLTLFSHFLAELHQQGIFFRGIHLGNILQLSGKANNKGYTDANDPACVRHALIDISDLSVSHQPLSLWRCARNMAHAFKTLPDDRYYMQYGLHNFIKQYFSKMNLTNFQQKIFLKLLNYELPDYLRFAT